MSRTRAALVVLGRSARNTFIDIRYGKILAIDLKYWRKGLIKRTGSLLDIGNADYVALDRIFTGRIKDTDVLVDVGCRKGRAFNWWLNHGLKNRMIGVEIDGEVAAETRRRLRKFPNVEIVTGDILTNMPRDGTLWYLYNPFDAGVMEPFNERLKEIAARNPEVRVIYYNCKHVDVFQNDPAWQVEMLDIDTNEAFPFPKVALITQSRPIGQGGAEAQREASGPAPATS